jgi:hypothetical protein
MAELKSRVNSHFCSDLLDGKSPNEITYTASEVGIYLSEDFLIENWDDSDSVKITFDITYYPYPTDHSKNPLVKPGLILSNPLFA